MARSVAEAAGNVAIVGDPEIYRDLGLRVVPDRYPGEGPLGGIITALHDAGTGWSLILACDIRAPEPGSCGT